MIDDLVKPRTVSFWGGEYQVTPVLVDKIFGDGRQIIGFAPLNTRPDYYVVRIDSGWCLSNWETDAPDHFVDHVDEVYEAIEDEYGNARWCPDECEAGDCQDRGEECLHGKRPWPALDEECGSAWWLIEVTEATEATEATEEVS